MWRALLENRALIQQLVTPMLEVVRHLPEEQKEAYIDKLGDLTGEVLIKMDQKFNVNIPGLSQEQEEAAYRWAAQLVVGFLADQYID